MPGPPMRATADAANIRAKALRVSRVFMGFFLPFRDLLCFVRSTLRSSGEGRVGNAANARPRRENAPGCRLASKVFFCFGEPRSCDVERRQDRRRRRRSRSASSPAPRRRGRAGRRARSARRDSPPTPRSRYSLRHRRRSRPARRTGGKRGKLRLRAKRRHSSGS